jgi:hypothetical protein
VVERLSSQYEALSSNPRQWLGNGVMAEEEERQDRIQGRLVNYLIF